MTLARLSSLSLAAIAPNASALATSPNRPKNVLPRRRTLRPVSRFGRETKIAMTGITFVVVAGTGVTVVVPIRGTSTARTAHARTRTSIVMVLVRCICSGAMATATTTTTIAAVAGMAVIVVDTKIITTIARIATAVTPFSKATTLVYANMKLTRGKVMAGATTATISAAAIGTAATAAPKQIRNCQRHHFCTAKSAHAWTNRRPNAARNARCSLGLEIKSVTMKTTTADATGTEATVVDLITTIVIVTSARV